MPMRSNEERDLFCGEVDRGRGLASYGSSQHRRQQQRAGCDRPRMVLCPLPEGTKGQSPGTDFVVALNHFDRPAFRVPSTPES